jgi:anti-sigma regulatory factor (Ser/Thr protein kinase)
MSPNGSLAASMPVENTPRADPRLVLKSNLENVDQLWPWVDAVTAEYAVPADTLFAIHLCLEEALSNVIRHAYREQPGHHVTIDFARDRTDGLVFTVEDNAPPFDPLGHPAHRETLPSAPVDPLQLGGHGIRLMRKFAGGLGYMRLPNGNRLTIRFALPR